MNLTEEELKSDLWLKIEKHLQENLDTARKMNDRDQPDVNTYMLRGDIRTLKRLLRLRPGPEE